jgi:hypothetical protein
MSSRTRGHLAAVALAACSQKSPATTATQDAAADASPVAADAAPAACADYSDSKNVYWGDLHTHTALSADAYEWGNRNFPHDAYQFAANPNALTQIAAGAPTPGPEVSIDRALDFDAITDHSEWLDATWACGQFPDGTPFNTGSANTFNGSTQCQAYRGDGSASIAKIVADALAAVGLVCAGGHEGVAACVSFTASAWQVERQAAHDAYQRCTFTPLVAYEWTHSSAAGATLHQNVIFGSEDVPNVPFDSTEYQQPTDLWSALDQACTTASGCSVLTIPHNSNLSQGQAFALPAGVDALKQMNQYQRLVEIHQHKGNSECYAGSNAPDPTCDFEHLPAAINPMAENPQNFVRHAIATGIVTYATDGVDPLQMGIVGATDDHNGTPGAVREDTWQGHVGDIDDTPVARLTKAPYHNPGGITGVWATQNTREDIFAALYRRETFATSGPRIAVRFYQVWTAANYCTGAFPGNVIADGGVAMGGTMAPGGGVTAPQFVVSALKDSDDLAEVDIVKGMYVGGAFTETIQRFTPSSPNTTWTNGSVCLGWTDPAFASTGPAFYYVRVLQVPTPRWSHYDCLAAPTTAGCGSGGTLDVDIQERAWTSPIWWLP